MILFATIFLNATQKLSIYQKQWIEQLYSILFNFYKLSKFGFLHVSARRKIF